MISCLQIHRNNEHRHCAVWFGLRFVHMVLWIWFGKICWSQDIWSQSQLCSPAQTCCDAINSYHLFPLRLRKRSCKLNVTPLLLFLKPQEDLHMQLTEPIFIAAHEKGERLIAVCPDKGSGNAKLSKGNRPYTAALFATWIQEKYIMAMLWSFVHWNLCRGLIFSLCFKSRWESCRIWLWSDNHVKDRMWHVIGLDMKSYCDLMSSLNNWLMSRMN